MIKPIRATAMIFISFLNLWLPITLVMQYSKFQSPDTNISEVIAIKVAV